MTKFSMKTHFPMLQLKCMTSAMGILSSSNFSPYRTTVQENLTEAVDVHMEHLLLDPDSTGVLIILTPTAYLFKVNKYWHIRCPISTS